MKLSIFSYAEDHLHFFFYELYVHLLPTLGCWSFPSQFSEVPYKLGLLFLHDILQFFSLLSLFCLQCFIFTCKFELLFFCSYIYLYVVIHFPIGSGFWDGRGFPLPGSKVSPSYFLPWFHFVQLDFIWNFSWCEVWGVDPIKYFPMLF